MARPRKTQFNKETLRAMYIDQNMTVQQIADANAVSGGLVEIRLREFGIKRETPRNLLTLPEEEIKRLYANEKMPMRDIGERVGCSYSTVRDFLIREGAHKQRETFNVEAEVLRSMYWQQGMNMGQIAEHFDVSETTVVNKMNAFGIERSPNLHHAKKMSVSVGDLRAMYVDRKMSDAMIGKQVGVDQSTVAEWRKQNGIETRTGSERQRLAVQPKRKMTITEAQLREMYIEQKMSDMAIGRSVGVSNRTVSEWRKYYSIAREAPVNLVAIPAEELKELYTEKKLSMKEIASHFRCGESTVRAHIIKNGIGLSQAQVGERVLAKNKERYTYRQKCDGYRKIQIIGHPAATKDGYVPEHRHIAESAIGRYLEHDEAVHHINMQKLSNEVENLAVLTSSDHHRLHKYLERVAVYLLGFPGSITPKPLVFSADAFWGGKWIKELDLVGNLPFRFAGSVKNDFEEFDKKIKETVPALVN